MVQVNGKKKKTENPYKEKAEETFKQMNFGTGVSGSQQTIDLSFKKWSNCLELISTVQSNSAAVLMRLCRVWDTLDNAILGLPRPRRKPRSENIAAGEAGSWSDKVFASNEEFYGDFLPEKQEEEWNRVQYAIQTGGVYVYGGSLL